MKILKLLFVVAMIQMITASCNSCESSKKEDVQEESAVEMTDEGSESMEATGGGSEEASGAAGAAAATQAPAEAIDATTSGVEEVPVDTSVMAEELASTPVVYPGCEGGTNEEIRACSIAKFRAFIAEEFNHEKTKQLGLAPGEYQIRSIVKVDEQGKLSVIRTDAPQDDLKPEMKRVIDKCPKVTPATKDGNPVSVTFALPLDFKVQ